MNTGVRPDELRDLFAIVEKKVGRSEADAGREMLAEATSHLIFIGSPIWWHNPAMVVCTFLEHYDLSGKIVVPFFTYGATTYLQASINKIYEVTPNSTHLSTYTGGDVTAWLRSINIVE